ncbi:anti-sigma factor family protein [Rhodocaloribacter sp.]
MDTSMPAHTGTPPCPGAMEEALNLYLDGELSAEMQPFLFAHLSVCASCRRRFDAVLKFRRMSRQEYLAVPPSVDDAFFKKLARHKKVSLRVDRASDRRPLWNLRTPVTLRSAVIVAVVLFLIGVMLPGSTAPEDQARTSVLGEEERVEFVDLELPPSRFEAVYVFYPGLTIEAKQIAPEEP